MSGYTGKKWNIVNTSKTNVQTYNNQGRAVYNNKSKANLQNALENRRSFVPNVTQLKSKIQDTGDNHPKQAVLMMGHGSEGWKPRIPIEDDDDDETIHKKWKDLVPDMVKVPKGSIVVVKSHPGDVTLDRETMKNFINCLSKENEHIVLDPVKYSDDITRLFGSVSIFREGDMCPNLTHANMDSFDDDKNIELGPSGIVHIPNSFTYTRDELETYIRTKVTIPKNMTVKQYKNPGFFSKRINIEPLFKFNTNSQGENMILERFKKLIRVEEFQNYDIIDVIEVLGKSKDCKFKQSDVFEYRPNTITYAFNCRAIDNHEHFVPETVRLGVKSKNNLKGIVDYYVPKNIRQKRDEHNVSTQLNRKNLRNTAYKGNPNLLKNTTRKNNSAKNLKNIRNRSRVKNMAGEIKQEISESFDQRRLGALSIAKKSKNTYTSDYIDSINFTSSSDINNIITEYKKLYKLKDETPNLKDKLDKKLYELSVVIYKPRSKLINSIIKSKQSEEQILAELNNKLNIDLAKYPELYAYLKEQAKSSSFLSSMVPSWMRPKFGGQ
jgi:hypothetical protein